MEKENTITKEEIKAMIAVMAAALDVVKSDDNIAIAFARKLKDELHLLTENRTVEKIAIFMEGWNDDETLRNDAFR